MPLVIVNCRITGKPPTGIGRKMSAIYRTSLRAVAGCWHGRILEGHFTNYNDSRYRFDPRNRIYMEEIKKNEGVGGGRYIKDLLKGQSLRWLRTFATISATQHQAVLRMNSPTYFEHPFIGSFVDPQSGRLKNVTRQPNKPNEITQINSADHAMLEKFARGDVTMRAELAIRGI